MCNTWFNKPKFVCSVSQERKITVPSSKYFFRSGILSKTYYWLYIFTVNSSYIIESMIKVHENIKDNFLYSLLQNNRMVNYLCNIRPFDLIGLISNCVTSSEHNMASLNNRGAWTEHWRWRRLPINNGVS